MMSRIALLLRHVLAKLAFPPENFLPVEVPEVPLSGLQDTKPQAPQALNTALFWIFKQKLCFAQLWNSLSMSECSKSRGFGVSAAASSTETPRGDCRRFKAIFLYQFWIVLACFGVYFCSKTNLSSCCFDTGWLAWPWRLSLVHHG